MSDSQTSSALHMSLVHKAAPYDAAKVQNLRSLLDSRTKMHRVGKARRASDQHRDRGSSGGSRGATIISTGSGMLMAPPPNDLHVKRKNS